MLALGRRFVLPSARTGELAFARQGVAPPFRPAGVSCPSRAGVWPLPENPSSIARSPDFGHPRIRFSIFFGIQISIFQFPIYIFRLAVSNSQLCLHFPQIGTKVVSKSS